MVTQEGDTSRTGEMDNRDVPVPSPKSNSSDSQEHSKESSDTDNPKSDGEPENEADMSFLSTPTKQNNIKIIEGLIQRSIRKELESHQRSLEKMVVSVMRTELSTAISTLKEQFRSSSSLSSTPPASFDAEENNEDNSNDDVYLRNGDPLEFGLQLAATDTSLKLDQLLKRDKAKRKKFVSSKLLQNL
jgi:hypothetical protein